ncbi:MAG: hypothetical protein ACKV19_13400 [Verrucomicrobiales bacterium]
MNDAVPPEPPPLPPARGAGTPPPPPAPGPTDLNVPQPPPYLPMPAGESQFASDRGTSNILLYLGIGCGLLVLLAIIAVVASVMWGVRTATRVASEIQGNPDKFAAEMIVKSDPDIEWLSSDDTKGEITFRDKRTGQILTVSFSAAVDDILKAKTGVPTTTVTSGEPGQWTGAPDWFPVMPGLTVGAAVKGDSSDAAETIHLTAVSRAPIPEIVTFYSDELDKLGFTISRQSQSVGSGQTELLEASEVSGTRHVTLNVSRPQPDSQTVIVGTVVTPK